MLIKLTREILNLNISAPRQKLKNLVHKILGKELLYPMHYNYFLSASKFRGGNLSDIHTSMIRSEKMNNMDCSFLSLKIIKNIIWSGQKVPGSMMGRPLIYCRSKVSSGGVGSGPIS